MKKLLTLAVIAALAPAPLFAQADNPRQQRAAEERERAEQAQNQAREQARNQRERERQQEQNMRQRERERANSQAEAQSRPPAPLPDTAAEATPEQLERAQEQAEARVEEIQEQKTPEEVEQAQERAESRTERLREQAKDAATDQAQQNREQAGARAEQMREQAEQNREQAEQNREQAEARAERMREQAAGNVPEQAERNREQAEARAEQMREQAAENREQAEARAEQMREQADENREQAEGRAERMRENAGDTAAEADADAAERARRAQERVAKMRREGVDPAEENAPSENPRMQATETDADAATEARAETTASAETDNAEAQAERERTQRERRKARENATAETRQVLEDRGRRNRDEDRRLAEKIDDDDDAEDLIFSILGGAAAGAIAGELVSRDDRDRGRDGRFRRLPPEQVGRTQRDRDQSVNYLVRRFQGDASWDEAPSGWRYHHGYRDGYRDGRYDDRDYYHQPHYFHGNHRVVYYTSYNDIPPILLASRELNRVNVTTVQESPYQRGETDVDPAYYNNIPDAYLQDDSYAVSYEVDPDSAVTRDDILFQQGSTAFADAYSYDLVVDLAEAMNSSELQSEQFIVEGHASAEGDYSSNLRLSQERAERIARDLVDMGVSPDRLIPVGYGETEARYPADAPEAQRALDRRVMVFRMQN